MWLASHEGDVYMTSLGRLYRLTCCRKRLKDVRHDLDVDEIRASDDGMYIHTEDALLLLNHGRISSVISPDDVHDLLAGSRISSFVVNDTHVYFALGNVVTPDPAPHCGGRTIVPCSDDIEPGLVARLHKRSGEIEIVADEQYGPGSLAI